MLEEVLREQMARRPHILELDLLRVFTACSVVTIHVLSSTTVLYQSVLAIQIQNAFVTALHYSREIFMFVTALALVYVYFGRPFPLRRFWWKRGLGVLLPYVVWSALYTWVNNGASSLGSYVQLTLLNIVTGGASYQLYYILLTLQFYLVLPLFVLLLKYIAHMPWRILIGSFVLQVAMLAGNYYVLQRGMFTSPFWQFVSHYQGSFVLTYQFYFVLGGFTALYFTQVRAFVLRHGRLIIGALIVSLSTLWFHYVALVRIYHEPIEYASAVLQPLMAFFALSMILAMLWVAFFWTRRADQKHPPKGYGFVKMIAMASFSIYLVHVLILDKTLEWLVPQMPTWLPVMARALCVWLITLGSATLISLVLVRTPFVSYLVGRPGTDLKLQLRVPKVEQHIQSAQHTTS